jgi:hypothetical protein
MADMSYAFSAKTFRNLGIMVKAILYSKPRLVRLSNYRGQSDLSENQRLDNRPQWLLCAF